MLKLIDLLKNKKRIYQLLQEWGFNLTKDTPRIYPDADKDPENARFCLLVETDSDLIKTNANFVKNENLRISYLKDELAIILGCDLLVHSNKKSKSYKEGSAASHSIALTEPNKSIIKHFDKYQFIKDFEDKSSLYKILFTRDSLESINEFKKQIFLVKHKIHYVYPTETTFKELILNNNISLSILAKIKKMLDSEPEVLAALKKNPHLLTMAKNLYFDNWQYQSLKHLASTNSTLLN